MAVPVRVSSAAHRVIRLARELGTPHGRKKHGLVLLEGLRVVETAGSAGGETLLVTARVLAGERGRSVAEALEARGVPVFEVADALFRAVSLVEAPQGIALLCPPPRVSLADALAAEFVVIADRLQDPGNLGALLRCARAFGAGAVIATKGCVEAANPKAVRAAAGAWPGLPVAESAETAALCRELARDPGRRVLVADSGSGRDFRDPVWRGKVALVLGSEGRGADPRFVDAAEMRVRIPLAGAVESLNVTAAAAILLAEAARQRGGRMPGAH